MDELERFVEIVIWHAARILPDARPAFAARSNYMAQENLDAVRHLAKDLRSDEPRSAREKLGGHELAARALDKCRATLAGTHGDYEFNCPLDRRFFEATGIDAGDFRAFVATGASDEAVGRWIEEHTRQRE
jgi:hypothetical protein